MTYEQPERETVTVEIHRNRVDQRVAVQVWAEEELLARLGASLTDTMVRVANDLWMAEHGPKSNGPNASLIAAAPDMLAALKVIVSHPAVIRVLAPEDSLGSVLRQALDAITKAEGGTR